MNAAIPRPTAEDIHVAPRNWPATPTTTTADISTSWNAWAASALSELNMLPLDLLM
jgi:hypothetical protein